MESTVVKIAYRLSITLLAGLLAVLSWHLLARKGDAPIANPIASPFVASPAAAKLTAPSLVNPVNPLDFGAKCDGATDDTAAFQAAVNAGDVLVPAGTCVINGTVAVRVSNKHIQCEGTILKRTTGYKYNMFLIGNEAYNSTVYTNDSIVNCNFVGANSVAPAFFDKDARHYDIPVETYGIVNNFFLAGNSFKQFFGQSMFQTYSPTDAGSGDVIVHNTFTSCGYYGPVFVAHRNGYIGHNVLIDCALGVENDDPGQMSGGNIIEYNQITAVHGYGAPDMGAAVLLTGGTAGGANYSTNIVRYNKVTGAGSASVKTLPSIIWQKASGGAALYLQNTCANGCKVIR
jgi:hypothetical protein